MSLNQTAFADDDFQYNISYITQFADIHMAYASKLNK